MEIIFVSGTGTEVGKTYVVCSLARRFLGEGKVVGVYKPVASDCIRQQTKGDASSDASNQLIASDAVAIWEAAGRPKDLDLVCPQRFEEALAPDEAARRAGTKVDTELLWAGAERWREQCELLIVEGAGGLFSPIADDLLNIDLFQKFDGAALYLVAPNRLGVIHDVVATCRAAEAAGISVARLYLTATAEEVDPSVSSNKSQIQDWVPDLDVREVAWKGEV